MRIIYVFMFTAIIIQTNSLWANWDIQWSSKQHSTTIPVQALIESGHQIMVLANSFTSAHLVQFDVSNGKFIASITLSNMKSPQSMMNLPDGSILVMGVDAAAGSKRRYSLFSSNPLTQLWTLVLPNELSQLISFSNFRSISLDIERELIVDINNTADGGIEIRRISWLGESFPSFFWSHPDKIALDASTLLVHENGDYMLTTRRQDDLQPTWGIARLQGDGKLVWLQDREQELVITHSLIDAQLDSQNAIFLWSEGENKLGNPALELIRMSSTTGIENWVKTLPPNDPQNGMTNYVTQIVGTSTLVAWSQTSFIEPPVTVLKQWDAAGKLSWEFDWPIPDPFNLAMNVGTTGNLLVATNRTSVNPPRPIAIREFDQLKMSCQEPTDVIDNGNLNSVLAIDSESWLILYNVFIADQGQVMGLRKLSSQCPTNQVFSDGFEFN